MGDVNRFDMYPGSATLVRAIAVGIGMTSIRTDRTARRVQVAREAWVAREACEVSNFRFSGWQ